MRGASSLQLLERGSGREGEIERKEKERERIVMTDGMNRNFKSIKI